MNYEQVPKNSPDFEPTEIGNIILPCTAYLAPETIELGDIVASTKSANKDKDPDIFNGNWGAGGPLSPSETV